MDDGSARSEGRLTALMAGQAILFGGDRVTHVSTDLAATFKAGDRLIVLQDSGDLLHIPAAEQAVSALAVGRAAAAAAQMTTVDDTAVTAFFEAFARRIEDAEVWARISTANAADIARTQGRGRSTTRLVASDVMRADMVSGLRAWRDAEPSRGRVLERMEHPGWQVEQIMAPLGVVGFVFEGRPNVFADATGVLRGGNTVVFRIGSDALATARAIVAAALDPALAEAGLPAGAATLVDSAAHAAGWAMFADPRLALAVARGSGVAVAQLGAIARQAGTPVSLHGTGGAWLVADATADTDRFFATVFHSLDRKVCNTLNVCCLTRDAAARLLPVFLQALMRAGERRRGCKLHMAAADFDRLPEAWRTTRTIVIRAEGPVEEPLAEPIADTELGREWEWEETPEVSLKIVADIAEAVSLFNALSPRLAGTLISSDLAAQDKFYATIEAPFVGDGFTRWVDGQYALNRPELGLSNWEHGRLFARSAVLAGDGVFTVRTRVRQSDPHLDRGGAPTPARS